MELTAKGTINDTLARARADKKSVTLHLRSGASFAGRVGDLSDHLVVIAELSGKEFYDALVRIEDVCALEVRARDR